MRTILYLLAIILALGSCDWNLDKIGPRPCFEPTAVQLFTISEISSQSTDDSIKVDCTDLPCVFPVSGKLEGISEPTCDNKVFINVLIRSLIPGERCWHIQSSTLIDDISEELWHSGAQYGDTLSNKAKSGNLFWVRTITSQFGPELENFATIKDSTIGNVLTEYNAILTPFVTVIVQ